MCSSIDHTHLPINWSDILPLWESESLPSGHVWSDLPLPFTPFDIHVTMHHVKFLIIKPTRCTNFPDLFLEWNSYMFRTVPLSINRSFSLYTQQWYMLYRLCWLLASGIRVFHLDPASKQSA